MSGDMADGLRKTSIDDPRLWAAFARNQVLNRSLSEAIDPEDLGTGQVQSVLSHRWLRRNDRRPSIGRGNDIPPASIAQLDKMKVVPIESPSRIGAVTKLDYGPSTYLYEARVFDPQFRDQIKRSNDVLRDYRSLLYKSRVNQLRFNAALLLGSLIVVGLAIFTALKIADRMVRPVGELVGAAGRLEEGDFSARVPVTDGETEDEVQTLATAFNRMAGRLEEQTDALKSANTQLDARRAFMEAVLTSVTAGVIAVDSQEPHPAPEPVGRNSARTRSRRN